MTIRHATTLREFATAFPGIGDQRPCGDRLRWPTGDIARPYGPGCARCSPRVPAPRFRQQSNSTLRRCRSTTVRTAAGGQPARLTANRRLPRPGVPDRCRHIQDPYPFAGRRAHRPSATKSSVRRTCHLRRTPVLQHISSSIDGPPLGDGRWFLAHRAVTR